MPGTLYKALSRCRHSEQLWSAKRKKKFDFPLDKRSLHKSNDVFFADLGSLDLGELYYHRQAGARPVVIVQNDVGCFFSETLTIVPLTSQLKRPDLESHYILQEADFLKKRSMALAEAINTIDKRQIRFYLGRLSDDDMAGIDAAITSHLGYEIAWCMEAP